MHVRCLRQRFFKIESQLFWPVSPHVTLAHLPSPSPPPHLLLFSQLPSSSFTPWPSRTQTHLLILSFRFPRRPPPSPRPAVSRPLWLPPQTSLPAPQDVWRRTVFLTTSTFKAPDGLRWGWHFPTERRAREAHTHPLPTPTALLSSERNVALVDTRDQGDVKGQEQGADPPEAPAQ